MRRVIMESPYAGNVWQRWRNRRYARACLADCLRRGEAPFASHLLYTQRGVLRDGRPAERQRGIAAGFAWLAGATASAVYVDRGISSGMRAGIAAAMRAGVAIEFRALCWTALPPATLDFIADFCRWPSLFVEAEVWADDCRVMPHDPHAAAAAKTRREHAGPSQ